MTTEEEARIFGIYIVGSAPSQEIINRYEKIVRSSSVNLTKKETAIISFAQRHPRLLPAMDAYAAIFKPHLELRRRLFIMFAVLEATPKYSEEFLPKDRGILYLLTIAGVSLRAVFRVFLGVAIMGYIGVRR